MENSITDSITEVAAISLEGANHALAFIDFQFQGRKWTIFKRLINGKRQENFSFKSGKVFRSLGTPNKILAIDRAKKLIAAMKDARWDVLEKSKARQHKAFATIGELVEAFKAKARTYNESLRKETATEYTGKLKTMIRYVFPERNIEKISTEILTADFVDEFKAAYLKKNGVGDDGAPDILARESAKRGGYSVITQARAMFSPVAMKCYKELRLPDLKPFMDADNFRGVKTADVQPITMETIKAISQHALGWKETNPGLYVVHLLFKCLAMRDKEIESARVEWIERAEGEVSLPDGRKVEIAGFMAVIQRSYFDPKKTAGRVPIAKAVMVELEPFLVDKGPLDFIVPAEHKTARWELIYIEHSQAMRKFIPNHPKSSYELRRWASSVVRLRQGSDAQEQFLRHKPKSVAGIHYSYQLPVAPITLEDCGL